MAKTSLVETLFYALPGIQPGDWDVPHQSDSAIAWAKQAAYLQAQALVEHLGYEPLPALPSGRHR